MHSPDSLPPESLACLCQGDAGTLHTGQRGPDGCQVVPPLPVEQRVVSLLPKDFFLRQTAGQLVQAVDEDSKSFRFMVTPGWNRVLEANSELKAVIEHYRTLRKQFPNGTALPL
jgi:hypothetical protein